MAFTVYGSVNLFIGQWREFAYIIEFYSLIVAFLNEELCVNAVVVNQRLQFRRGGFPVVSAHPVEGLLVNEVILIVYGLGDVLGLVVGYEYRTGIVFDFVSSDVLAVHEPLPV